jgi:hypothetical protein
MNSLRMQGIKPAVYIEAPFAGSQGAKGKSNHQTTVLLLGFTAIARGILAAHDCPPELPAISSIRAAFLGRLNGKGTPDKKRAVLDNVTMLGWQPQNDNESDAAALWYYGVLKLAPAKAPIVDPLFLKNVPRTKLDGGAV